MARPTKTGLDYFPLDVDFFDDEKIIAISGEFGLKGELATIKLLCAIYRNGYFILWNELTKFKLVKSLPGVSSELVESIVNRLVRWEFFDKTLFDSVKVLTSRGIQRRYFEAAKRRKSEEEYPYLLVNVCNNPINVCNNPINADINATKKRKVKENKEKETKVSSPQSPPGGGGGDYLSSSLSQKDGKPRNFEGLCQSMQRLGIPQKQQDEIMRLSDYGVIGHPVWPLLRQCEDSLTKGKFDRDRIRLPGHYILSKLKEGG